LAAGKKREPMSALKDSKTDCPARPGSEGEWIDFFNERNFNIRLTFQARILLRSGICVKL
jgi:hypothetical protein